MENRKTSGSIVGGIVLIAIGATLIISFLSTAIYNIASLINLNGSDNDFDSAIFDGHNGGSQTMNLFIIVAMFFMAMASSVLIVIGIITLKRGVVNKPSFLDYRFLSRRIWPTPSILYKNKPR